MRGADLINLALPDELLDDVLRRVGAGADGTASKRDLDACALVCRRWHRLERASRRRAKLAASGASADEVVRLVAERFPALTDVSVDERLTVGNTAGAGGASCARASRSRSRRSAQSSTPFRRRRRLPHVTGLAFQTSPFPLDQPAGDDGTERNCLTDAGLAHLPTIL